MRGLILLCLLGMFFPGTSVSGRISVDDDREGRYFEKKIQARHVTRVEAFLVKEVIRDDCNLRSLMTSTVLAFGEGKGLGDTYFVEAGMIQTKMHCPLPEPVTEEIRAKVADLVPDGTAPDGQIDVTLIVPAGYAVELIESKHPEFKLREVLNQNVSLAPNQITVDQKMGEDGFSLSGLSEGRSYDTRHILTEDIKGVDIRVSMATTRFDCNQSNEHLAYALVAGDGRGVNDTYLVKYFPATMQTLMHCPYNEPVTEKISTKPLLAKIAPEGGNAQKGHIILVIPVDGEVEVSELNLE